MTTDKPDPTKTRDSSANQTPCWNCAEHPTERMEQIFVDRVQRRRIDNGEQPAQRAVFRKQHGGAHGRFEPLPDLPQDLKVGTFAHGPLPCWLRFSSDVAPDKPDLHRTIGVGIKLFDVPGPKLFGEGETADFIMQNHDVFFVNDAQQFCEFTTAGVIDGDYPAYLEAHPDTKRVLAEMQKPAASCLTASYWALLPFAFGEGDSGQRYVKYRLTPVDQPPGVPFDAPDYLSLDLASRLRRGEARFKFELQFRTDPETMPLDEAMVRWDSAWVHVADLILPRQNIEQRGQAAYVENLSFNIWRTPPEQEPQGSIAQVRRRVYKGSADQRRLANGVTLTEPLQPAPARGDRPLEGQDRCIVKAAIYPPIGVCRVGNSPEDFYIGPEVPNPPAQPAESYRDGEGRLKREAARFRIYGLNAIGEAVAELTCDNADIEWSVHIANQKAAWYEFQLALDIPEASDAPPSLLRNSTISERSELVIDPGPRQISGRDQSDVRFDTGAFMGERVYLGELRTDAAGRLVALGGHGKSGSYDGTPAVTFANNEGWYDDTSDGPVSAKVVYAGVELEVDPAWVITGPPNYGPQQKTVRSMWDLMRDVAVSNKQLPAPELPNFQSDILPLFQRMHDLQWVNQGFAAAFGFGGQFDYTTEEWIERLRSPSPAYLEQRRTLANNWRHELVDSWSPVPWPWIYGDAMSNPAAHTPLQYSQLSSLQLRFLEQWVAGNFVDEPVPVLQVSELDELEVCDQPAALTRAAMEFCLADAFHPGVEMTWPVRNDAMYMSPFRLLHRKRDNPEPGYGAQLDSTVLTLPDGPIQGGQSPGSVTRWMAIPWQTDTASCRSGYDKKYDPYLPTFWPARVPNQVMSEAAYAIVMDSERPLSERIEAFSSRADWLEPLELDESYTKQLSNMIHHFDHMGIIAVRAGPADSDHFPAQMQVSDQDSRSKPEALEGSPVAVPTQSGDPVDLSGIEKINRFPHKTPCDCS